MHVCVQVPMYYVNCIFGLAKRRIQRKDYARIVGLLSCGDGLGDEGSLSEELAFLLDDFAAHVDLDGEFGSVLCGESQQNRINGK